jgi:CelD/BcsL family acetyltransferase involved in cellulose biosynthesis
MNETIEWIDDAARFEALADAWDEVARSTGHPFMRHAWLASWWHAFGAGRHLFVCTVRRGGKLVAALPLWRRGTLAAALANAHTPTFAPIAADHDALEAVVGAALAAGFPSLVVGPMPAEDESAAAVARMSQLARRQTWTQIAYDSPIVDLADDPAEFRRRLARGPRRELERLRRKLEREQAPSFELLAEPPDPLAVLERGLELEQRGWKGRRGTAILSSAPTAAFYREVAAGMAAAGMLRLSTLWAGGRLLAFDYGIVSDGALWLPKGAYDEEFRRYAPGLLLLAAEIERAHELGLERVELLGSADPYKLKFASRARRHLFVHSHAWRPVPLARSAYARVGRPFVRSVYRKALSRWR